MATSYFCTYFLYNRREIKEQRNSFIATSLPFVEQPLRPKGRLTALFGYKSIIEGLSYVRKDAFKTKNNVCGIDIQVEIGQRIQYLKQEDIPKTQMVNITRLSASTAKLVNRICSSSLNNIEYTAKELSHIIQRSPELLNTLWHSDEFHHIKVFIWPQKIKSLSLTLASIRSPDDIADLKVADLAIDPASVRLDFS
jgi:hypothetical protein